MILTSGDDQNSYVTLEEANLLLMTCAPSFVADNGFTQLGMDDEKLLIEAARDLETLWSWNGQPSTSTQALAWPRRYVAKPGWQQPLDPLWHQGCAGGWSALGSQADALRYQIDYLIPGMSQVPYLDDATVPAAIRQAQALLALLRKNRKNLVGDSQGDTQGLQLDSGFRIAYANAARDAADITTRLAGLGWFVGDALIRLRA